MSFTEDLIMKLKGLVNCNTRQNKIFRETKGWEIEVPG